jgi:hypothetical protein
VEVNQLIRLNPAAWTEILQSKPENRPVSVTDVGVVRLSDTRSQYLLSLEGHPEPVVFQAKRTNTTEARFYRELSPQVSFLTPRCLFSYVNEQRGWVVLDDVPDHRPAIDWGEREVERIIGNLAALHISFWGRVDQLLEYEWLDYHIKPAPAESILEDALLYRSVRPDDRRLGEVSAQTRQHTGSLLPAFQQAAISLRILHDAGGWPGIIDRKHLEAIADLLDDPLPMLIPLRRLPSTLLHRNLASHHWRMTMFGDCALLDWQRPAIGPAVCDLVQFVEQFELVGQNGLWKQRPDWPMSVETMIDTYLLRLYDGLWPMFNAREIRRAIPAARCLHVITYWLPRMVSLEKQSLSLGPHLPIRAYLRGMFRRFWHAYRTL